MASANEFPDELMERVVDDSQQEQQEQMKDGYFDPIFEKYEGDMLRLSETHDEAELEEFSTPIETALEIATRQVNSAEKKSDEQRDP